jgi:hypothetical protein
MYVLYVVSDSLFSLWNTLSFLELFPLLPQGKRWLQQKGFVHAKEKMCDEQPQFPDGKPQFVWRAGGCRGFNTNVKSL